MFSQKHANIFFKTFYIVAAKYIKIVSKKVRSLISKIKNHKR